jgi:hypothetical protein
MDSFGGGGAMIMPSRCLHLLVCVAVGVPLSGCRQTPEPNLPDLTAELAKPDLTAEQAKAALIDLLRSTDLDYMRGFPLDQFAEKPAESHQDGSASWADFRFDLKARRYSYIVERGERNTKGHFAAEYEGEFEFKQGKWVAAKPHVKWIT